MMSQQYDLLVCGGELIDPGQSLRGRYDVATGDGRVAAVAPAIAPELAAQVIDATGLYVTPGLIDLHAHGYVGVAPISVDLDELAARSGTTTMVDAGSAGAATFDGFRRYIVEPARCRVLSFLNISIIGLAAMPECGYGPFVQPQQTADVVVANRDVIVGIKIRASHHACGDDPVGAVWLAREAAIAAQVPVIMHIGEGPPALREALRALGPGDLVTHSLRDDVAALLDGAGALRPETVAARERGVLFDVGHGAGSFHWPAAERLMELDFWPDTISTDVHTANLNGPVYDMPTTMSKLLNLGMPLDEVIRRSTIAPAQAIGRADEFGALQVGMSADIATLELREGDHTLTDSRGQERRYPHRLVARHTICRGAVL